MRPELQKKIDRAIKLLRSIPLAEGEAVEVSYSGGKDSDVILQLTKEAGINYRAIYKNTTIDPPGTAAHARQMGAEVVMPDENFFSIVKKHGLPSRWARFCCTHLKEYKILDRAIQGIRRSESNKRAARYKEPELCRKYSKDEKARVYLPILDWTDQDVADFVADRKIQCHPLYYTDGVFHVERRLGCMGCPMVSRRLRLAEFRNHPNLVKAWVRASQEHLNTHDKVKAHNYKDGYGLFVRNVFYDSDEQFFRATDGLMGNIDPKTFLEDYFKIKFNENTMPQV